MKHGIFTDLHVGLNINNETWENLPIKAVDFLTTELRRRNINSVLFLGDFYHDKKELSIKAIDSARVICEMLNDFTTYIICGNHDAYFESISATNLGLFRQATNFKLNYLKNSTLVYHSEDGKAIKIFGTPYCHRFGMWPFMRDESYMEEKFKEIPDDVDIIISHDPPYGVGQVDCILQECRNSRETPENLGNIALSNRIKEINFKLLVSGHIHSGDHNLFDKCVNVSHLDEFMDSYYEPFYTEIETYPQYNDSVK